MPRQICTAAALLLGALCLNACDDGGSAATSLVDTRPMSSALVTGGGAASADSSVDWAFARNDSLLGRTVPPPTDEISVVTLFGRDRIRTVTGQAIDTSSTQTYSFRRRLTR
jgi:hypothetical protein